MITSEDIYLAMLGDGGTWTADGRLDSAKKCFHTDMDKILYQSPVYGIFDEKELNLENLMDAFEWLYDCKCTYSESDLKSYLEKHDMSFSDGYIEFNENDEITDNVSGVTLCEDCEDCEYTPSNSDIVENVINKMLVNASYDLVESENETEKNNVEIVIKTLNTLKIALGIETHYNILKGGFMLDK